MLRSMLSNYSKYLYQSGLIASASFMIMPGQLMAQENDEQVQEIDASDNGSDDDFDDEQSQETDAPENDFDDDFDEDFDEDSAKDPIVVTADRIRGSVISNLNPIEVLTEDDIASYGADSIQDLLTALAPQTGSARGRGGGQPIVLINAIRVSGFRELRNIPPEAIIRVEILPEEVALQYGFQPDQRVINFILKEDFSSTNVNGSAGLSTSGGYNTSDIGATYTKFTKNSRFNADIDFEQTSTLTEDERNITQEDNDNIIIGPIGEQDIGQFRTLLPNSNQLQISATYSKTLSPATSLSGNLSYTNSDNFNLFGLNNPILTIPQSNQFNDSGADLIAQRFFIEPRPLQSTSQTDSFEGGFGINSSLGGWQVDSTIDASYVNSSSLIDQNSDFTLLQQSLLDDDTVNIFADIFDPNLTATAIISSSVKTTNIDNFNTLSGILLNLPNGEVSATLSGGYNYSRIDSDSDQSGQNINTLLSRNIFSLGANIDVPITDSEVGIGKVLGRISVNGDFGLDEVSDFGSLSRYTLGLTWEPIDGLSLTFSSINEDTAPTIEQLGNPIIVTPNVPIFDFIQSETSFVALTTGANPNLLAERQRDIKISLNFSPKKLDGLDIIADYSRNRSFDTSNAFPLLTPEIEAAFQDRVTRDANGTLVALDQTPVIFDRTSSDRIRYGFNFSKRLGASPRGRPGGRPGGSAGGRPGGSAGGRPGGSAGAPPAGVGGGSNAGTTAETPSSTQGQSTSDNGNQNSETNAQAANTQGRPNAAPDGANNGARGGPPAGAGGRPAGARGGPPGGAGGVPRRPGRFNISLFHTLALNETILISPEVTELDLLDGSAIGANGGAARHTFELEGGIFNNGLGLRVTGNFRSATTVDGDILTGASDLRFGSLATLDLRIFYDLGSKAKLTKAIPFLKGSRISLNVQNIGNAIQNITDENGDIPRNFQRGFVDPRGRFISASFRKRF